MDEQYEARYKHYLRCLEWWSMSSVDGRGYADLCKNFGAQTLSGVKSMTQI